MKNVQEIIAELPEEVKFDTPDALILLTLNLDESALGLKSVVHSYRVSDKAGVLLLREAANNLEKELEDEKV